MRRTKILATLGPACNNEETIYRLMTSGVDAFRLNFSHGSNEDKMRIIKTVRECATSIGRYVPIVGDIQGPKLRIGDVDGVIQLQNGQLFVITTETMTGNAQMVSTPFKALPKEVSIGHRILIMMVSSSSSSPWSTRSTSPRASFTADRSRRRRG